MISSILQNIYFIVMFILQHETMQPVKKDFWFYFVYVASTLIVLAVIILTIKYLINPKEESKNHIKRIILEDEGEKKN
ncbi:hypothetical protein ABRY23_00295 [Melioribacteraceae bacterium 4301-Me]|uniref:hypothetical protein n=1 Tax=Pyranulibacter aquaticus TaxID=3163344 RepID=UPI003597BDA6